MASAWLSTWCCMVRTWKSKRRVHLMDTFISQELHWNGTSLFFIIPFTCNVALYILYIKKIPLWLFVLLNFDFRYWKVDLWRNLFTKLLNIDNGNYDPTLLSSIRHSFEEYMISNPHLIKKLKDLLVKQRTSLCQA